MPRKHTPECPWKITTLLRSWGYHDRIDVVEALLDMRAGLGVRDLWISYKVLGIPVRLPCKVHFDGEWVSTPELMWWCGLEDVDGS